MPVGRVRPAARARRSGSRGPTRRQAPTSRPSAGSPTARLTPARAQTPKERTKVVKPMPEQHAVEGGGQRHRHHPAPVLRQLAADLGHDPRPADLEHGGEQRDPGRHQRRRRGPPAPWSRSPSSGERAEGDHARRRSPRAGRSTQAAIVVRRPPVWPVGPIVSITESPQGEKVPVAPISSAATLRGRSRVGADISSGHLACRSTGRRTPCGRRSSSRSARRPR